MSDPHADAAPGRRAVPPPHLCHRPVELAALLALCRLGYDRACRVCGPGCGSAEAPCDIVLITGPCEGGAFDALVSGVAGHVREGGVLVVHEAGLKDDERVRILLAACGREAGWCVHDLSHGCLVAFQVLGRRAVQARAA